MRGLWLLTANFVRLWLILRKRPGKICRARQNRRAAAAAAMRFVPKLPISSNTCLATRHGTRLAWLTADIMWERAVRTTTSRGAEDAGYAYEDFAGGRRGPGGACAVRSFRACHLAHQG